MEKICTHSVQTQLSIAFCLRLVVSMDVAIMYMKGPLYFYYDDFKNIKDHFHTSSISVLGSMDYLALFFIQFEILLDFLLKPACLQYYVRSLNLT
jgi:hypothetical protein